MCEWVNVCTLCVFLWLVALCRCVFVTRFQESMSHNATHTHTNERDDFKELRVTRQTHTLAHTLFYDILFIIIIKQIYVVRILCITRSACVGHLIIINHMFLCVRCCSSSAVRIASTYIYTNKNWVRQWLLCVRVFTPSSIHLIQLNTQTRHTTSTINSIQTWYIRLNVLCKASSTNIWKSNKVLCESHDASIITSRTIYAYCGWSPRSPITPYLKIKIVQKRFYKWA